MIDCKIDRLPLPADYTGKRGRPAKYPLRQLQAGESFFWPALDAASLRGCCNSIKDMKFTVRKAEENGVAGFRVWRVE